MKKLTVILAMALCVLTAVPGLASEWADGLSPEKPYSGVPEVDLTQKLGYMMFYPNANMPAEHFCRTLYIYLPREDVEAGRGVLYLCSEEEGELLRFEFGNEEYVKRRALTEEELDGLLWGGGVCFEITLPEALKLNEGYFVNLDRDCIVTADGKLGNLEIGGTDSWAFRTDSQYGVSGLQYRRPLADGGYEEMIHAPKAGDEVSFELLLGGEAASAAIYCYDDAVDFDSIAFSESATVTGQIMADCPVWGIAFLNGEGELLDCYELGFDIAE